MTVQILIGDCREKLRELPDASVHCCVCSPPYFNLRDYQMEGQIGLEATPDKYIAEMVAVFREVRRALRGDATLWLNIGDTYGAGKQLLGMPWRLAFALQGDGWILRQDIIWAKPNPMPESTKDRCTKAHEYLFLLSKGQRYYFDAGAIAEAAAGVPNGGTMHAGTKSFQTQKGGKASTRLGLAASETRNKRSVWEVVMQPFSEAHFATYPPALIEPCILAGCPKGGTVLDPFGGAGTTGLVADRLGRNAILIELNPEYAGIAKRRLDRDGGMFAEVMAA